MRKRTSGGDSSGSSSSGNGVTAANNSGNNKSGAGGVGGGSSEGFYSSNMPEEILNSGSIGRSEAEQQQQQDISLLRQPLRTAFMGFQEAKRAYENGTNEVRRLLMNECNLIYECNVCLNMFRSLANFISHKRIFCRTAYINSGNKHGYPDQNSSFIIQTDAAKRSRSTGTSPIPATTNDQSQNVQQQQQKPHDVTNNKNDLNKVIKRLKSEKISTETKTINDDLKNTINHSTPNTTVLQLERVPTSNKAVYQTLKRKEADSIKTEVDEVTKMLSKMETVLGPDGKAVDNNNVCDTVEADIGIAKQNSSDGLIACEICKLQFQTEKTLKIHLQKKHISSTYVFQCPACTLTFLQPSAVIRHLASEHKKPVRRIRMMRDTILKKRIQVSDVQVKGPSRELKRLQMLDNDNTTSTATPLIEESNTSKGGELKKVMSKCIYCEKFFERRAALSTHLMNCTVKLAAISKKPTAIAIKRPKQQATSGELASNEKDDEEKNDEVKSINEIVKSIKVENSNDQQLSETQTLNEMYENLEKQTFGSGLRTVSLDKLDMMEQENTNTSNANVDSNCTAALDSEVTATDIEQIIPNSSVKTELQSTTTSAVKSINKKCGSSELKAHRRFRIMHADNRLSCRCKICNKQFNALSNLRRHISMFHYRARRFGCKLCDYRAFRRYDIVNHLGFVHKMTGEREAMSLEYVAVHEVHYSKDDVEGDIVLITDDKETIDSNGDPHTIGNGQPLKTYEKRAKRNKLLNTSDVTPLKVSSISDTSITLSEGNNRNCKKTRQRLKRSHSQQEVATVKPLQKRPIRNRIKPVNKDFVYDLSNLLKKDMPAAAATTAAESKETDMRCLKRRNTVYNFGDAFANEPKGQQEQEEKRHHRIEPLVPNMHRDLMKGATRRITLMLVNQGRAKSSTLPELPSERPQMRPRLTSTYRIDVQAKPVIETTELEETRKKSTLFEDTFFEKFTKRSSGSFKIKPCVSMIQTNTLDSFLTKVDLSLRRFAHRNEMNIVNQAALPAAANESLEDKSDEKMYDPIDNSTEEPSFDPNSYQNASSNGDKSLYSEPEATILATTSPPPTPRKRITLMQRLAENKAKSRESLLRSALEH